MNITCVKLKWLVTCYFFQLVPGYRGYTIDSIRQLTILDDVRISADEKHFFKGLSKLKGNDFKKTFFAGQTGYDLTSNIEIMLQS